MIKTSRLLLVLGGGLAVMAALLALMSPRVFAQDTAWRGEYFDNANLLGTPRFIRMDPAIDFNWWDGSPGAGIPADNFSVRWTRDQYFNGGTYRFAAAMDDGMRIYMDNTLVLDSWFLSALNTVSKDVAVAPGYHTVMVVYFEGTGQAAAAVDINQIVSPPIGGGNGGDPNGSFPNWKAEYFTNQSVSGAPAVVRDDRYIHFDWGTTSPVPGYIPADRFSVRWTRTANFPAGQYKMRLTSDDGSRLFINGVEIVNNWGRPILQPVEASYWHPGGPATVRVDYYDVTGPASMRLDLIQVPGGFGVLPPTGYPGGGGGGFPILTPIPPTPVPPIPQCPSASMPTGLSAVVVSPTNLNIRRDPTTLSEISGQIAPCTVILLTGYRDATGQWVQTTQNGLTGWVTTQFLLMGVPTTSLTVGP